MNLSKSLRLKLDQDRCHVVAAEALAGVQVLGAALVEHCLHALDQRGLRLLRALLGKGAAAVNLRVNKIDRHLRGHHVPNAIARQQHELRVRGQLHALNIRERCNRLVFCF